MKKTKNNKMQVKDSSSKVFIRSGLIVVGLLFVLSICLGIFTQLGLLESFRIVFGSVYVLFLPGFLISYIFFPQTKEFDSKDDSEGKSIDLIERIALSFALSIAIVPLAVFYLNLAGIRINLLNSTLTILAILVISAGILYWKINRKK